MHWLVRQGIFGRTRRPGGLPSGRLRPLMKTTQRVLGDGGESSLSIRYRLNRRFLEYLPAQGRARRGRADCRDRTESPRPAIVRRPYAPRQIRHRNRSGGQTQGAWTVPSKALGYFGSTERRAYWHRLWASVLSRTVYAHRSVYCPPDMGVRRAACADAERQAARRTRRHRRALAAGDSCCTRKRLMYFALGVVRTGIAADSRWPRTPAGAELLVDVPFRSQDRRA